MVFCPIKFCPIKIAAYIGAGRDRVSANYDGDLVKDEKSKTIGCMGMACGLWDEHRNCCGLRQVVD